MREKEIQNAIKRKRERENWVPRRIILYQKIFTVYNDYFCALENEIYSKLRIKEISDYNVFSAISSNPFKSDFCLLICLVTFSVLDNHSVSKFYFFLI